MGLHLPNPNLTDAFANTFPRKRVKIFQQNVTGLTMWIRKLDLDIQLIFSFLKQYILKFTAIINDFG